MHLCICIRPWALQSPKHQGTGLFDSLIPTMFFKRFMGIYRNMFNFQVCGFGSEAVMPPKKDWSPHYKKDGDRLICSSKSYATKYDKKRRKKTNKQTNAKQNKQI